MSKSVWMILASAALLSACGGQRDLKPAEGAALPPAPYGAERPRTAQELLEPETQARPERNVELRKRSEERAEDPFDLPPQ